MNTVVNSQALAHELRLINQIAPVKPGLPILKNVLLQAEGTLYLYATDLEIGLSTQCRAEVIEPGQVTLPAKHFLDIVEQLPDADVRIAHDGKHVHILSGAFRSRLQSLPPDDFPSLPTIEGEVTTFDAASLQAMVKRVRYAVSDKNKHVMNGALFSLQEKTAVLVATDGKRLTLASMSRSGAESSAIIPAKALDALSIFSGGQMSFSQGAQHLFFQGDGRLLFSRMLDGQFPAYERIIPQENDLRAEVDRAALAAALRRVGLASEESAAVVLAFSPEGLDITASSAEVGDAAEQVAIRYDGATLRVRCNWRHVLDFLEAAVGQTIMVALKDEKSPMLLKDGDQYWCVILLMRNS